MKRFRHVALALVAAAMHVAAPVAAYAQPPASMPPGDFCSVTRTTTAAPGGGVPLPASSEHHCAHAPCCAGGAVNAAAPPPPALGLLRVASGRESLPAAIAIAAPAAPIAAAQPRGPPQIS
jgi:hypothetical protein